MQRPHEGLPGNTAQSPPKARRRQIVVFLHRNGQAVAPGGGVRLSVVTGVDSANEEAALQEMLGEAARRHNLHHFPRALHYSDGTKVHSVNELEANMDLVLVPAKQKFQTRSKTPRRGALKTPRKATDAVGAAAGGNDPVLDLIMHKYRGFSFAPGGHDPASLFRLFDRDRTGALDFGQFMNASRQAGMLAPGLISDDELEIIFTAAKGGDQNTSTVAINAVVALVWGAAGLGPRFLSTLSYSDRADATAAWVSGRSTAFLSMWGSRKTPVATSGL